MTQTTLRCQANNISSISHYVSSQNRNWIHLCKQLHAVSVVPYVSILKNKPPLKGVASLSFFHLRVILWCKDMLLFSYLQIFGWLFFEKCDIFYTYYDFGTASSPKSTSIHDVQEYTLNKVQKETPEQRKIRLEHYHAMLAALHRDEQKRKEGKAIPGIIKVS